MLPDRTAHCAASVRTPSRWPRLFTPLLLAGLLLVCASATASDYAVDPDTGYRMARYRAPVPRSVPGGQVVTTADVRALLSATAQASAVLPPDTVLIDVYPPRGAIIDPLTDDWLLSDVRESLPGATWLPEVGRGYLDDIRARYFRDALHYLSAGRSDAPLLFFCTADCWQSWNAARRAALAGYTRVYWYPEGTDGWREIDGTVQALAPLSLSVPTRSRAADDR